MATSRSCLGPDLDGHRAGDRSGASGIGAGIAHPLADAGAKVHRVDRDAAAAEKVAAEVGGERTWPTSPTPLRSTLLGPDVDILVNNAGLQHVAPLDEFDPERFTLIQRVMLEAPFRLARRVLPGMYERGWGRIVNISSVHGLRARAYKSAYVTAKHGLEGLSKVIALEGAGQVSPATASTPGTSAPRSSRARSRTRPRTHGIAEAEVLDEVLLARSPSSGSSSPRRWPRSSRGSAGRPPAPSPALSFPLDGGWTAD